MRIVTKKKMQEMCKLIAWVADKPTRYTSDIQKILAIANPDDGVDGACIMAKDMFSTYTTYKVAPVKYNFVLSSINYCLEHKLKQLDTDNVKHGIGSSLYDIIEKYPHSIRYNNIVGMGRNRRATLGSVSIHNVGPHVYGRIALLHNGTVIKYADPNGVYSDSDGIARDLSLNNPYNVLRDIPYGNVIIYMDMEDREDCIYLYNSGPVKKINTYAVYENGSRVATIMSSNPIHDGIVKLVNESLSIEYVPLHVNTLYKVYSNKVVSHIDFNGGRIIPINSNLDSITKVIGNYHAIQMKSGRFYHNGMPITTDPETMKYQYWYKLSIGYCPVTVINIDTYEGVVDYTGEIVNLEDCKEFVFYNGIAIKSIYMVEDILEGCSIVDLNLPSTYVAYAKYPILAQAFTEVSSGKVLYDKYIESADIYIEEVGAYMYVRYMQIQKIELQEEYATQAR